MNMELPEGKTCGDCIHIAKCVAFGFSKADNTTCDFLPNRFRLPAVQPDTADTDPAPPPEAQQGSGDAGKAID